jgi:hypothetical protein
MYVSDDNHNVICLDALDLSLLWQINVGEQVAASIAVAPEGDIYCVTRANIYKIKELDNHSEAVIEWRADLSTAFPGYVNINALTPTIVANGVVIR